MHEYPILRDLVIIFATAIVVVAVLRRFGIPPIAGFILSGAIVGPQALGFISDPNEVSLLAEIGVALLLFGIGLELSLERLRRLWRPVLIGGALQVGLTLLIVILAAPLLGISRAQAFWVGSVVAVSSTAIVLRGLESRGELDAPQGRMTLGILIFQDLCVVPMMLAIPIVSGSSNLGGWIWIAALVTLGALGLLLLAARLIVPRLLHLVARTRQRDLFILAALLVCMGTAWVASLAGVSLALGAFLAGLIVAGSEYRHQAMADLISLREVLTGLFFVSIGMLLGPRTIVQHAGEILGILILVIVGKALVVMLVARLMNLPLRVAVLTSLALAQIGEFSFVLYSAAKGTSLEAVPYRDSLLVAIILSMIVTPFLLTQAPRLADLASRSRILKRLYRISLDVDVTEESPQVLGDHVIIAGWGVSGQELGAALKASNHPYIIADLNPETVRRAAEEGEPIVYGDVTISDVLEHLGIRSARMFVVVVNDPSAAERAVRVARRLAPTLPILVRARYLTNVDPLIKAGATDVVPAEIEAAVEVTARVLLSCGSDMRAVIDESKRIRERKEEDIAETTPGA